jgi:hypothetical protein
MQNVGEIDNPLTALIAGENFYGYVENDPINYIDSWGLCSNDVKKIVNAARNAVNNMTLNHERINSGSLNNIISTERRLNPFTLPPYKGCGEQTDNVINNITPLPLDCNWEPQKQFEWGTRQHILPHQWVNYVNTTDPTDPSIVLDPWNNRYQLVPPGSKLDNKNWHPLVPSLSTCCNR